MMRRATLLASILAVAAAALTIPGIVQADNLSVGVQTSSMNLGIHIGNTPPPVVAVPGPVVVAPPGYLAPPPPPAVYTARDLPYNYFVYQKYHYLYHEGRWFRARRHSGPWTVLAINQVPRPVLAVPVERYKVRPEHWEHHGPPPWAHERERERERDRHADHGRGKHGGGHGKGKGRD
jgi:hypothetical protein